jgi:hypothetical protein
MDNVKSVEEVEGTHIDQVLSEVFRVHVLSAALESTFLIRRKTIFLLLMQLEMFSMESHLFHLWIVDKWRF